jgi:1,4-alpha-glucan branching enzyme
MNQAELLEAFHKGQCRNAWRLFGARFSYEGGEGVRFTLWAPHAYAVSVIGSFNHWDPQASPMSRTQDPSVWSVFIPGVREWDSYKYHIVDQRGSAFDKADPFAFYAETRPASASKVFNIYNLSWSDERWMLQRNKNFDAPVSIYEVHAGGWRHDSQGHPYNYPRLKDELVPYAAAHGFTHIEFMPLSEYPFDGSWGYQASGYYAVTSRYGNPREFAGLVNACHARGLGVIMDMVPVHFAMDAWGLRNFDGEPLYEYPRRSDARSPWGTLYFDLGRQEVRSFLISAVEFWCRVYHVDGVRVDAVSNLIYWNGEEKRGENEAALSFIRRLNESLEMDCPGVMKIAEDSSTYPGVTRETGQGGLGFDYKWDLGWMNDTLSYYSSDTYFRRGLHHQLVFSMEYFYSERFLLPFSHDENVHGKKTIISRMFGSYEEQFAGARCLYAYMFAHPGKKLNFMGNEIASFREFDEKRQLDWMLLDFPRHEAFQRYFQQLNMLYRSLPCLYEKEEDPSRFLWIDSRNDVQSVYIFARDHEQECLVCLLNNSRSAYQEFVTGVPYEGTWKEVLNTDDKKFGGTGIVNSGILHTRKESWGAQPFQLTLRIAPLSAVWLLLKKS